MAGEQKLNEGLDGLHTVVSQTSTAALDVTEDSGNFVGNTARRETRKYSSWGINSTRRGSRMVSNEGRRYTNTVHDISDDVVDLGDEQIETYSDIVLNSGERVLCTSGKIVGTGVGVYTDSVHRMSSGIFGCLFGRVFVDTKPYMVGSANDRWPVAGMPGSSWKGPRPQVVQYVPAATSAKEVTYSK